MTHAAWAGFIYDLVANPIKHTLKNAEQDMQTGRSHLTPILAAKVVLMSSSERAKYFEDEYNKLDTIERDLFRYYVAHNTFMGYTEPEILQGI